MRNRALFWSITRRGILAIGTPTGIVSCLIWLLTGNSYFVDATASYCFFVCVAFLLGVKDAKSSPEVKS